MVAQTITLSIIDNKKKKKKKNLKVLKNILRNNIWQRLFFQKETP